MAQGIERSANAKPQTVCIDLPGESVQCWRSTDKVQVILKKHRDVIFELSLAQEKKYTVESTGSDFYNANKKKLLLVAVKNESYSPTGNGCIYGYHVISKANFY